MNYESFLICFHADHTDLYHNGLPIGVIRDGAFHVHQNKMPDGTLVPVRIPDHLKAAVVRAVEAMP